MVANTRPVEANRRRPDASGTPVRLADGADWLLAAPGIRAARRPMTAPDIDASLDVFHECLTLGEDVPLADVWKVARALLRANYVLDDDELADLLEVAEGREAEALAGSVLDAVFGSEVPAGGFTDWVRAGLIANGLGDATIDARDLPNVLRMLVATQRMTRPEDFVDACRLAGERSALEHLV